MTKIKTTIGSDPNACAYTPADGQTPADCQPAPNQTNTSSDTASSDRPDLVCSEENRYDISCIEPAEPEMTARTMLGPLWDIGDRIVGDAQHAAAMDKLALKERLDLRDEVSQLLGHHVDPTHRGEHGLNLALFKGKGLWEFINHLYFHSTLYDEKLGASPILRIISQPKFHPLFKLLYEGVDSQYTCDSKTEVLKRLAHELTEELAFTKTYDWKPIWLPFDIKAGRVNFNLTESFVQQQIQTDTGRKRIMTLMDETAENLRWARSQHALFAQYKKNAPDLWSASQRDRWVMKYKQDIDRYEGRLADIAKAVAVAGKAIIQNPALIDQITDEIATYNLNNWFISDATLDRAVKATKRILDEVANRNAQTDAYRNDYAQSTGQIPVSIPEIKPDERTFPLSGYEKLGIEPTATNIQLAARLVTTPLSEWPEAGPAPELTKALADLYLFVADDRNWTYLGREEADLIRTHLANQIHRHMEQIPTLKTDSDIAELADRCRDLFTAVPRSKKVTIPLNLYRARTIEVDESLVIPDILDKVMPSGISGPYHHFRDVVDQFHFAGNKANEFSHENQLISRVDQITTSADPDTRAATVALMQGLESLQRRLWVEYKKHWALSRFGSDYAEAVINHSDTTKIRDATAAIDQICLRLTKAKTPDNLISITKHLVTLSSENGSIGIALEAAEADLTEEMIGLAQTCLSMIPAGKAIQLAKLATIGSAIGKTVESASRISRWLNRAGSFAATKLEYGALGAWASTSVNLANVATEGFSQPRSLKDWLIDAAATTFSMSVMGPTGGKAIASAEQGVVTSFLRHIRASITNELSEELLDSSVNQAMRGNGFALSQNIIAQIALVTISGGGSPMMMAQHLLSGLRTASTQTTEPSQPTQETTHTPPTPITTERLIAAGVLIPKVDSPRTFYVNPDSLPRLGQLGELTEVDRDLGVNEWTIGDQTLTLIPTTLQSETTSEPDSETLDRQSLVDEAVTGTTGETAPTPNPTWEGPLTAMAGRSTAPGVKAGRAVTSAQLAGRTAPAGGRRRPTATDATEARPGFEWLLKAPEETAWEGDFEKTRQLAQRYATEIRSKSDSEIHNGLIEKEVYEILAEACQDVDAAREALVRLITQGHASAMALASYYGVHNQSLIDRLARIVAPPQAPEEAVDNALKVLRTIAIRDTAAITAISKQATGKPRRSIQTLFNLAKRERNGSENRIGNAQAIVAIADHARESRGKAQEIAVEALLKLKDHVTSQSEAILLLGQLRHLGWGEKIDQIAEELFNGAGKLQDNGRQQQLQARQGQTTAGGRQWAAAARNTHPGIPDSSKTTLIEGYFTKSLTLHYLTTASSTPSHPETSLSAKQITHFLELLERYQEAILARYGEIHSHENSWQIFSRDMAHFLAQHPGQLPAIMADLLREIMNHSDYCHIPLDQLAKRPSFQMLADFIHYTASLDRALQEGFFNCVKSSANTISATAIHTAIHYLNTIGQRDGRLISFRSRINQETYVSEPEERTPPMPDGLQLRAADTAKARIEIRVTEDEWSAWDLGTQIRYLATYFDEKVPPPHIYVTLPANHHQRAVDLAVVFSDAFFPTYMGGLTITIEQAGHDTPPIVYTQEPIMRSRRRVPNPTFIGNTFKEVRNAFEAIREGWSYETFPTYAEWRQLKTGSHRTISPELDARLPEEYAVEKKQHEAKAKQWPWWFAGHPSRAPKGRTPLTVVVRKETPLDVERNLRVYLDETLPDWKNLYRVVQRTVNVEGKDEGAFSIVPIEEAVARQLLENVGITQPAPEMLDRIEMLIVHNSWPRTQGTQRRTLQRHANESLAAFFDRLEGIGSVKIPSYDMAANTAATLQQAITNAISHIIENPTEISQDRQAVQTIWSFANKLAGRTIQCGALNEEWLATTWKNLSQHEKNLMERFFLIVPQRHIDSLDGIALGTLYHQASEEYLQALGREEGEAIQRIATQLVELSEKRLQDVQIPEIETIGIGAIRNEAVENQDRMRFKGEFYRRLQAKSPLLAKWIEGSHTLQSDEHLLLFYAFLNFVGIERLRDLESTGEVARERALANIVHLAQFPLLLERLGATRAMRAIQLNRAQRENLVDLYQNGYLEIYSPDQLMGLSVESIKVLLTLPRGFNGLDIRHLSPDEQGQWLDLANRPEMELHHPQVTELAIQPMAHHDQIVAHILRAIMAIETNRNSAYDSACRALAITEQPASHTKEGLYRHLIDGMNKMYPRQLHPSVDKSVLEVRADLFGAISEKEGMEAIHARAQITESIFGITTSFTLQRDASIIPSRIKLARFTLYKGNDMTFEASLNYGSYESKLGFQWNLYVTYQGKVIRLGYIGFQESDSTIDIIRYQGAPIPSDCRAEIQSAFRQFSGMPSPILWLATMTNRYLAGRAQKSGKILRSIQKESVSWLLPHKGIEIPEFHSLQQSAEYWNNPNSLERRYFDGLTKKVEQAKRDLARLERSREKSSRNRREENEYQELLAREYSLQHDITEYEQIAARHHRALSGDSLYTAAPTLFGFEAAPDQPFWRWDGNLRSLNRGVAQSRGINIDQYLQSLEAFDSGLETMTAYQSPDGRFDPRSPNYVEWNKSTNKFLQEFPLPQEPIDPDKGPGKGPENGGTPTSGAPTGGDTTSISPSLALDGAPSAESSADSGFLDRATNGLRLFAHNVRSNIGEITTPMPLSLFHGLKALFGRSQRRTALFGVEPEMETPPSHYESRRERQEEIFRGQARKLLSRFKNEDKLIAFFVKALKAKYKIWKGKGEKPPIVIEFESILWYYHNQYRQSRNSEPIRRILTELKKRFPEGTYDNVFNIVNESDAQTVPLLAELAILDRLCERYDESEQRTGWPLQDELFALGDRMHIMAHGVEWDKGGARSLASIIIGGEILWHPYFGILLDGDSTFYAGSHGPFYVIGFDAREHLAYLVPNKEYQEALIGIVEAAGQKGLMSEEESREAKGKIVTYEEFLKAAPRNAFVSEKTVKHYLKEKESGICYPYQNYYEDGALFRIQSDGMILSIIATENSSKGTYLAISKDGSINTSLPSSSDKEALVIFSDPGNRLIVKAINGTTEYLLNDTPFVPGKEIVVQNGDRLRIEDKELVIKVDFTSERRPPDFPSP